MGAPNATTTHTQPCHELLHSGAEVLELDVGKVHASQQGQGALEHAGRLDAPRVHHWPLLADQQPNRHREHEAGHLAHQYLTVLHARQYSAPV
jgi:hypothetical protein